MTKQEIVALIAAKIEGQGTNVDAGSVLPSILNGIIDLIPNVPTPNQVLQDLTCISTQPGFATATGLTKTEAAAALGVSESDLDKLFAGSFLRLAYGNNGGSVMTIEYASPALLSMGAPGSVEVVAAISDGVYSITVTE